MKHEINEKTLIVKDCSETFETIYEKEYFPKELTEEIKQANVLLIPDHIKREDKEGYVFPECTQEFLEYVKDNGSDNLIPDIAINDGDFKKLELHSASITIATFVVTSIVLPIMINLVSNYIWCLQQVYKIQSSYLTAFERLKNRNFEEAWNTLDRTDIEISFLEPHFEKYFGCPVGLKFYIGHILNSVKQFQKLFPYRLFTSREDIIKEEKCSICGKKISLRHGCNHRIGQLYMGEMCCHEITDIEILAFAIVSDQFDKYAIIKQEGQEYNYAPLEQLMNVVNDPFTLWNVDELRVVSPEYENIGRNDRCPCGSGKKYKKCCLGTAKIYTTHYRINIANCEFGVIQPITFYNTVKK